MTEINFWITFVSRLFAITASGIAIYVFLTKRDKISSAIDFVLNYSRQITLTELMYKIERLNDYSTKETEHKKEIINILAEIEGQVNGSKILRNQLKTQIEKINSYIETPKSLSEPKKRSLVSELKESVRNIDVSNYNNIVKKKN